MRRESRSSGGEHLRRQVLGGVRGDAVLGLVALVPLHLARGDRGERLGERAEHHLPHRQARQALVAEHADVQLAPLDVLLDQRIGLHLLVHELDALLELRGVIHHRGLRDAEGGVLDGRLHEQREAQLLGHVEARAAAEHGELRGGDAVVLQQLLGQGLVARQQQAARIAAGVGLAHQLEEGHHVLVVGDDAVELLEQVEDDVRLPVGDGAAQLGEAVEHPEAAHLVAGAGAAS